MYVNVLIKKLNSLFTTEDNYVYGASHVVSTLKCDFSESKNKNTSTLFNTRAADAAVKSWGGSRIGSRMGVDIENNNIKGGTWKK